MRSNRSSRRLFRAPVVRSGRFTEPLESRLLMAVNSWVNPVDGDWSTDANWSLGHVPAYEDDVRIDQPGNYTVSYTGETTVQTLFVADGATLSVSKAPNFSTTQLQTTGDITVDGTIILNGDPAAVDNAHVHHTILYVTTVLAGHGQVLLKGNGSYADVVAVYGNVQSNPAPDDPLGYTVTARIGASMTVTGTFGYLKHLLNEGTVYRPPGSAIYAEDCANRGAGTSNALFGYIPVDQIILYGTPDDDVISVRSTQQVVTITMNGVTQSFNISNIDYGYVVGYGGNDRITYVSGPIKFGIAGSQGNDTLVGNSASTVALQGDQGNDLLDGSKAISGNTYFAGGSGNDTLIGGGGKNTLRGEGGDDNLDGGEGNDSLYGGAGNDRFFFPDALVDQTDVINEEKNEGTDLISFSSLKSTDGVNVNLTSDTQLAVHKHRIIKTGAVGQALNFENVAGGTATDTITGNSGNNSLSGGSRDDLILGGDGNDTLRGDAADDTLNGGDGNDTLYGLDAKSTSVLPGFTDNDQLFGGTGNDNLFGGIGVDLLRGEADNDTLFGQDGVAGDTLDGGEGTDVLGSKDNGDVLVSVP